MPEVALALYLLFLILAFGWRSWRQWRHTGDLGFRGFSGSAGPLERATGASFAVALVAIALLPLGGMHGIIASIPALDRPAGHGVGLLLAGLGIGITVLAQVQMGRSWRIGVHEGPHGSPELFTPDDLDALLSAEWRVQVHCARTGVRLDGPRPRWPRPDGGEAGLHPSNIHDTGYAFGTVDFTGDTPVVLGPDGPSLGGFTCPATVVAA